MSRQYSKAPPPARGSSRKSVSDLDERTPLISAEGGTVTGEFV